MHKRSILHVTIIAVSIYIAIWSVFCNSPSVYQSTGVQYYLGNIFSFTKNSLPHIDQSPPIETKRYVIAHSHSIPSIRSFQKYYISGAGQNDNPITIMCVVYALYLHKIYRYLTTDSCVFRVHMFDFILLLYSSRK